MVRQRVDVHRSRLLTVTPAQREKLAQVIDRADHLLFDFDGPLCDVYAGLPSATVAEHLRELIAAQGTAVPAFLMVERDPLEVLRFADRVDPPLGVEVEAALRAAEVTAVQSARATPGARQALLACRRAGRGVAVVSNNSRAAVQAYLRAHDLLQVVDHVTGRTQPDPSLLKPDPHLILAAVAALGARVEKTAVIGDSVSDIEAAHAASAVAIGFANKPGKRDRLSNAGADVVVDSMVQLADAFP